MNIIQFLGRGRLHEMKKMPCQDYADYYFSEDDAKSENIIMALSDGCSASKYAEVASRANVDAIIKLFKGVKLSDFLTQSYQEQREIILKACFDELKSEAKKLKCKSAREFCATLVFVVMDSQRTLVGHIGDGAAYCFDGNHNLIYTSTPQNGEESNITYFTVSKNIDYLHLAVIPRYQISNIMLCSDGPYEMLKTYGKNQPYDALSEIVKCLDENSVTCCQDLASKVIQMSSTKYEHNDDWSILLFDAVQPQCDDKITQPISMYDEIEKKFEPLVKAYTAKKEEEKKSKKEKFDEVEKEQPEQKNPKTRVYNLKNNHSDEEKKHSCETDDAQEIENSNIDSCAGNKSNKEATKSEIKNQHANNFIINDFKESSVNDSALSPEVNYHIEKNTKKFDKTKIVFRIIKQYLSWDD